MLTPGFMVRENMSDTSLYSSLLRRSGTALHFSSLGTGSQVGGRSPACEDNVGYRSNGNIFAIYGHYSGRPALKQSDETLLGSGCSFLGDGNRESWR